MIPFIYNNPTKVVFGDNKEEEIGTLLKEVNATNVLVVSGGKSVKESGLLDKVLNTIKESNITTVELSGVVPNPLLSKVNEGIELGIKNNVDFILAIGGGSVIDTAKTIAVGIKVGGNVWDFFDGTRVITKSLNVGCILTIPAAGSEMSTSAVITNDESLLKRSINFEGIICKFAIMNPSLTKTLPDYQTFCGSVDILMHTMERYFNNSSNLDLTDALAQSLMKTVIKYSQVLLKDPQNDEARCNIMWAGSLSHNNLMSCGNNKGDWATHKIEHELSALYDVAHGAGLSAIWASWARYVVEVIPHRFAKFAVNVFDIEENEDLLSVANKGIDKMEEFFKSINMPICIEELNVNVSSEDITLMASKCTNNGAMTIGTVKQLNKNDIEKIYNNAK